MSDEDIAQPTEPEVDTVTERPVGLPGTLLTLAALIALVLFVGYSLIMLWPVGPPNAPPSPAAANDCRILVLCDLAREATGTRRLMLVVALAGALGSLIHALRSYFWYVGNRRLVRSWLPMYFVLPLIGAALGVAFTLVIKAGFFTPGAAEQAGSTFGFAAFATLTGLFTNQAILKLQKIAETILEKPAKGADSAPQGSVPVERPKAVTLTAISPGTIRLASAEPSTIELIGMNFTSDCEVRIDSFALTPKTVAPDRMSFVLEAADIPAKGPLPVTVVRKGPSPSTSNPVTLTVV